MNTKQIGLAAFVMLTGIAAAAPVKVEGGLVEGTVEDGLTVHRGIPFAAPPVGDLRWRAPQPAAKWQGVRRADKFAPACMQTSMGNATLAPQGPAPSEDCLYLNVWSPARTAAERLPVLVWIYGGGFRAGATSIPLYSGENLARKGVVVVSIAYRVGLFGFLTHPGLSAESSRHVSGNYGLLDVIAGLEWVRKNIAAFGGNPRKVTVFGQSAGGVALSMLCASPLARGLFDGAIPESGVSFGSPRPKGIPGEEVPLLADLERQGEAWTKAAGLSSVAEMRQLPADKLLEIGRAVQQPLARPVLDGWVIPGDQYKLYAAGRYNDVPVLIGCTSDDAGWSPQPTPETYAEAVRKRFGKFADQLLKLYPGEGPVLPKIARDLGRDTSSGWHVWTWARLQSRTGKSKIFYYYFDQHPDYPAGSPQAGFGARHGAEVAYVFGHLGGPNRPAPTAEDQALSEAIITYWTNFAKRGDPNGEGVPVWPDFKEAKPAVMYFSHTAHPGPVPNEEGLKGLDAYFAWRRTPEGDAWVK
jgi:para-nitrobenzyl esterase